MSLPPARSVVAALLAATVGLAIVGPIAARIAGGQASQALPEQVVAGLVDLLKVITGGLIGWLSRPEDKA